MQYTEQRKHLQVLEEGSIVYEVLPVAIYKKIFEIPLEDLNLNHKVVLCIIISECESSDTDKCTKRSKTIAKMIGMSNHKKIDTIISNLETMGYIRKNVYQWAGVSNITIRECRLTLKTKKILKTKVNSRGTRSGTTPGTQSGTLTPTEYYVPVKKKVRKPRKKKSYDPFPRTNRDI